jgi:hypothetical protein
VVKDGPVFLRRGADAPMEGRSNRCRRAQAREAADVLDRLGGRLQQHACSVDPRIGEPGHRSNPGLLAKPTSERPSRHVRAPRERVEVERKGKVIQHPGAKRPELITRGLGAQPFDELRLRS